MLQRFYVHNFRCLENFELALEGKSSTLLIGKNGSGKSTVAHALTLMQRIGRGVNRVGQLIQPKDLARGRTDVPMRFELDVLLDGKLFKYSIAFEFPERFHELRVFDEYLAIDGEIIYSRKQTMVELRQSNATTVQFPVDWHLVALPVIQPQSLSEPLRVFKAWLAQMVILTPNPCVMTGDSNGKDTLEPERDGSNFGDWFSSLLGRHPAAYSTVDRYLKGIMPDLDDIENVAVGKDAKSWQVKFVANGASLQLSFDDLSDGEKCFFLCAVVLAANKHYGPLFCFWDEPDNYIGLSEVGNFMVALRRSVLKGGQLLVTSHNPEGISIFPEENTIVLGRKSHLEPTVARWLDKLGVAGDVVEALIRGDVEP